MTIRVLKQIVSASATAVLVACALALTTLAIKRDGPRPPSPVAPTAVPQPDWLSYATEGNRIGPRDARAILVEFSDFQCPACALLEERLRVTRAKFGDDFAVVYRHYPLPNHRHAKAAAIASECASWQGRFVQMHAAIFDHPDSVGTVPWDRIAIMAGVRDLKRFRQCLADSSSVAIVDRDIKAAQRLGVRGTPTILVAGVRVAGAPPQDVLDSLVGAALKAATAR